MDDARGATGADLVNDLRLQGPVDEGRVPWAAGELMVLEVGHVLDLDRLPGESLEPAVDGKVVASGERVG